MFAFPGSWGDRATSVRQGGGHLGGGRPSPRPADGDATLSRQRQAADGEGLQGQTEREYDAENVLFDFDSAEFFSERLGF